MPCPEHNATSTEPAREPDEIEALENQVGAALGSGDPSYREKWGRPALRDLVAIARRHRDRADAAERDCAAIVKNNAEESAQLWKQCEPYLDAETNGKTWAEIIKLFAEREKRLRAEVEALRAAKPAPTSERVEQLREGLRWYAPDGTGPKDANQFWKHLDELCELASNPILVRVAEPAGDGALRKGSETCWLVESVGGVITHWLGTQPGRVGFEVTDANHAIRFCRRQDAEKMIALWNSFADIPHLLSKATEHAWVDALAAQEPAEEQPKEKLTMDMNPDEMRTELRRLHGDNMVRRAKETFSAFWIKRLERALGEADAALGGHGWTNPEDVAERARGKIAQQAQHRSMTQKLIDDYKSDVAELTKQLDAARWRTILPYLGCGKVGESTVLSLASMFHFRGDFTPEQIVDALAQREKP